MIENMTGMDLLEKLAAAQAGELVEFTPAQAQALGAFAEDAIGDDDLDTPDQEDPGLSGHEGTAS